MCLGPKVLLMNTNGLPFRTNIAPNPFLLPSISKMNALLKFGSTNIDALLTATFSRANANSVFWGLLEVIFLEHVGETLTNHPIILNNFFYSNL